MTVPEAAMYETDRFKSAKDHIRFSWQLPIMKTVPEAASMHCAAKQQFGSRVPAADSRHHSRPDSLINYVSHELPRIASKERRYARISRNVAGSIKQDGVIVQCVSRAEFGHTAAHGELPVGRLVGHSRRLSPIAQTVALRPSLLGNPPDEQHAKCRSAVDRS